MFKYCDRENKDKQDNRAAMLKLSAKLIQNNSNVLTFYQLLLILIIKNSVIK